MTIDIKNHRGGVDITLRLDKRKSYKSLDVWSMPGLPGGTVVGSLLKVTLEKMEQTGRTGIRIASSGKLPGTSLTSWKLWHVGYQGTAPSVLSWLEIPIEIAGDGNFSTFIPEPMPDATYRFYLESDEGGTKKKYREEKIKTPSDTTQLLLENMLSDDVLSRTEKPTFILILNGILSENENLRKEALLYGSDTAVQLKAYDDALLALTTFLGKLDPKYDNLQFDTPLGKGNGKVLMTLFTDLYTAKAVLRARITELFNATIDDLKNDDVLVPSEKRLIKREVDKLAFAQVDINALADSWNVLHTAYDTAISNLLTYLASLENWDGSKRDWKDYTTVVKLGTGGGKALWAKFDAISQEYSALFKKINEAIKAGQLKTYQDSIQYTANNAILKAGFLDANGQIPANTKVSPGSITSPLIAANQIFGHHMVLANLSNLIGNPNSENLDNPVGSVEGASITYGNAYNGSYCRYAYSGSETPITKNIDCNSRETYNLQCQVKSDGNGNPTLRIYTTDGSGYESLYRSITGGSSTSYHVIGTKFAIPAGAKSFRVKITSTGPGYGYFDEFMLRLCSDATLIVDGSITGELISGDAIKTSNYQEDLYGNPTQGAKLGINTTQPLKVGPNGLNIGGSIFNQASLRTNRVVNGKMFPDLYGWKFIGGSGKQLSGWSSLYKTPGSRLGSFRMMCKPGMPLTAGENINWYDILQGSIECPVKPPASAITPTLSFFTFAGDYNGNIGSLTVQVVVTIANIDTGTTYSVATVNVPAGKRDHSFSVGSYLPDLPDTYAIEFTLRVNGPAPSAGDFQLALGDIKLCY